MTKQIKHIRKAQQMELIKSQIQLSLTKTELNQLIMEALADPESSAAIKKVLNPLLAGQFSQFPDFTNIMIGDTDEVSGATLVTLKQPATPRTVATKVAEAVEKPVMDPDEMRNVEEALVPETKPDYDVPITSGTAYIDPIS